MPDGAYRSINACAAVSAVAELETAASRGCLQPIAATETRSPLAAVAE
jgi:hypothetical protein